MEARIREQFALNKLTLLAVVLGDVRVEKSFYDEFVKSMATSVSNLVISPSLSPGVLELGRIHALRNAAVIYVPNTPALTIHPGEPPI